MRESRHIKVKVKLINQSWKSWALASRDILVGEPWMLRAPAVMPSNDPRMSVKDSNIQLE